MPSQLSPSTRAESKKSTDDIHSNNELLQSETKGCCFQWCYEPQEVWSELSTSNVITRGISELFGTALLVMVLCMGCLEGWESGAPPVVQFSLSVGLVVMFVVQIFGHISGAHVNPSITVLAVIYRTISLPMAGIYIMAQFLGAILGYGMLLVVTPAVAYGNNTAFCVTTPNPNISVGQAVIVEAIITGVLCLLTCSIWDGRNKSNTDGIALKFGLTVATLAMSAGSFTGASMNPARSFAPALWNNHWKNHWVYWVGPLLGSSVFSLFYCLVFKTDAPSQKHFVEDEPLREINDKSADRAI